jgi:hypothetical protein
MTPRRKPSPASFETRLTTLLRMTAAVGWHKEFRHPEEARSAVSKDARLTSSDPAAR